MTHEYSARVMEAWSIHTNMEVAVLFSLFRHLLTQLPAEILSEGLLTRK
jgi:hypothetical protein